MNRAAALELGEGVVLAGNKIGWTRRKLLEGLIVARYGWATDSHPKRLSMRLEGYRETQVLIERREDGDIPFSQFTWADIEADDWYVCQQLELVR